MFYNDYEDYMRNFLGYSNMPDNTYQRYDSNYNRYDNGYNNMGYNNMNQSNMNYNNMNNNMSIDQYQFRNESVDIEQMYPEIYRIINPMVCRMCGNNNQPVTEELVEQMTNEIYDNVVNRVEIQNIINVNIETRNTESREADSNECKDCNRSNISNNSTSSVSKVSNNLRGKEIQTTEDRSPAPRRRNRLLRDLIRILILNQLFRPNRPHFRPGPMPMPPRPWF